MHIKPPANIQLPESGTIDLMTTYEVKDGMLSPTAIDGQPFDAEEEEEGGEYEEEGEMEDQPKAGRSKEEMCGCGTCDGSCESGGFMAAIEQALSKR